MATILRCTNDQGVKYDLDLKEDIPFKLDISAIEAGEIGKIFGVSSQKFALPPTENNNNFFGNTYNVGATPGVQFIKTADCQILQDGQEVFSGKLYLDSVVTDNIGDILYNVVVVNETVDFKLEVQDLTFGDLDFSSEDHIYNYSNVTSSWDQDLKDGNVFYPLMNYGFNGDDLADTQIAGGGQARTFTNYDSPVRVNDFKPAVRLRTILDNIFEATNYSYTSSLFYSGSETDDIYMLASDGDRKGINQTDPVQQSMWAYTSVTQSYASTQPVAQVFFDQEYYDNGSNFSNPTFTCNENGSYKFEINLKYDIEGYNLVADARFLNLRVYRNGVPFDNRTFDLTGTVSGQINFVTPSYNLSATDEIDIRVVYTETASGVQYFVIKNSLHSRFQCIEAPTSAVGGTTDLSQYLSKINVLDFLDGIIQKFNLVIEPDPIQRNLIRINTFNDWIDQGGIKDWSNKVDYNEKWEIRHPLQSQPKKIVFSDELDNDAVTQYHYGRTNNVYGEFRYLSDSDLASGEKELGTFFAPLPVKVMDGSSNTIVPILATRESGQPYQRMEFLPRLVYYNGRQPVLGLIGKGPTGNLTQNEFYFQDEDGTVHAETDYGLAHHLSEVPSDFEATNDLHFGNYYSPGHWSYHQNQFNAKTKKTAFDRYWAFYINELYDIDSRLVTLNIFLYPHEIPQLRLNDRIHINGHYYRINKISGANVSNPESVQVELLKTLPRKLKFPRRRITLDDTVVDITVDDDTVAPSGRLGYVDFETGVPYTGDGLSPAADRDGFSVYGTDVVWDTATPINSPTFENNNLGLNDVDISVSKTTTKGDNNIINQGVDIANVAGTNNVVEGYASNVNVTGTTNTIGQSVSNSSIQNSNNSNITEGTELATIIGGDDTIISGSNKSVAIGQNTTTEGGNSNIVIGNFDTQTKTVKDMINTVVINPNRDIESRENLGAEDFSGRAYIGSFQEIGSHYSDNKTITLSAGDTLYLTGSDYSNDYIYNVTWSGGSGSANVYLPEVDPDIASLDKGQGGYKRFIKFMADDTVDSGKKVFVNVAAGDYLNDQFNGSYTIDREYEILEVYGAKSGEWRVIDSGEPNINNGGAEGAHGSFYDTTSQPLISTTAAQVVTLNGTIASDRVTLESPGRIVFEYAGPYQFNYVVQVANLENAPQECYFWVRYNGVDFPNSATTLTLQPRKNSTTPSNTLVNVSIAGTALNNFDYIELYWGADNLNVSLNASPAGTSPTRPATPSVIANVIHIG